MRSLRDDFPFFRTHFDITYLDSAATTQRPQSVIEAETYFTIHSYANVHRGLHMLGEKATEAFEGVRRQVSAFIGAHSPDSIVFTRNATEALNLAAWLERKRIRAGDDILISAAEHHSNILPWQRLACTVGADLQWIEMDDAGHLSLDDFHKKLSPKTKIVAVAHVSSVLGYVAPLEKIIEGAHRVGAHVVLDTGQSAGRMPVDVVKLDVEYSAFSGHKMYGPTGTGFLYGKPELLEEGDPFLVGGSTIQKVTRQAVIWQTPPLRYEAGTPHITGVVGLGAAIGYLQNLGWEAIEEHERKLVAYALPRLLAMPGLKLYGPAMADGRQAIFSFTLSLPDGRVLHSHDVADIVNRENVAIRGGHHCAQPLMSSLGVYDVSRASCGVYTNTEDVDRLVAALHKVHDVFS
jgi:cysteine desulfurase/selenocysteine lyase